MTFRDMLPQTKLFSHLKITLGPSSLCVAKVRALLAKSRIDLGQYERGLTDCAVATRLLNFEERLLGEREAAQVSQFCPNGVNTKDDSNTRISLVVISTKKFSLRSPGTSYGCSSRLAYMVTTI